MSIKSINILLSIQAIEVHNQEFSMSMLKILPSNVKEVPYKLRECDIIICVTFTSWAALNSLDTHHGLNVSSCGIQVIELLS